MKLYKVERPENTKWDWDQYDSFVCWANSEDEARHIHPGGHYKWHDDSWYFQYSNGTEREGSAHDWPDNPKDLKVWELSRAPSEPTVVLGSYNAG